MIRSIIGPRPKNLGPFKLGTETVRFCHICNVARRLDEFWKRGTREGSQRYQPYCVHCDPRRKKKGSVGGLANIEDRFNEDELRAIFFLRKKNWSLSSIARIYGVSRTTIAKFTK